MCSKKDETSRTKYQRMLRESTAANDTECEMSKMEMLKMMAFAAELAKRAREETVEPTKSRSSLLDIAKKVKLLFSGTASELEH